MENIKKIEELYEVGLRMQNAISKMRIKTTINVLHINFKNFWNGKSPTPFCVKNGVHLGLKDLNKFKGILKNDFNLNIK